MDDTQAAQVQTTDQIHQQTAQNISSNLEEILGTKQEVIPVTAETPLEAGDPFSEKFDRLVKTESVGVEPSKTPLGILKQKLQKMHPGGIVSMVKKGG